MISRPFKQDSAKIRPPNHVRSLEILENILHEIPLSNILATAQILIYLFIYSAFIKDSHFASHITLIIFTEVFQTMTYPVYNQAEILDTLYKTLNHVIATIHHNWSSALKWL